MVACGMYGWSEIRGNGPGTDHVAGEADDEEVPKALVEDHLLLLRYVWNVCVYMYVSYESIDPTKAHGVRPMPTYR